MVEASPAHSPEAGAASVLSNAVGRGGAWGITFRMSRIRMSDLPYVGLDRALTLWTESGSEAHA